jgi:hypothetical protein
VGIVVWRDDERETAMKENKYDDRSFDGVVVRLGRRKNRKYS